MSGVMQLIANLRDRGVHIWTEGGQLRYRSPSGSLTSGEIGQLRAHKQQILSILATTKTEGETPPSISRADRTKPLLSSFAQRRLWFLLQTDGTGEAFHIPLGLRIKGRLDESALRLSLDQLVERHETLRTRFEMRQGEVFQCIEGPEVGFAVRFNDLSRESDVEGRLLALITEEIQEPFDLERGPLARGRLIRISSDDHVLLMTLHHITADGWSMGVLARELSGLYNSLARGEGNPLQSLSIQYADYAAWQRRRFPEGTPSPQSAYWHEALAGAPPLLELPTDRPRSSKQSLDGDAVTVEFDGELTEKLKTLSRRYGMTPFMFVLAGWALVLSRLSGQDDIVIGTPTANRTHIEAERLIGLFVNTLVLRIKLPEDATVEALLLHARGMAIEAQGHQDLPFEKVVELANPVRDPAYTPLFQVMLAWQSNDPGAFKMRGLQASPIRIPIKTAKHDLTLELAESDGRIVGVLNYSTSLFDRDTALRHVGYLSQALSRMVSNVAQPLSAVDLLPAHERNRIVVEWNDTRREYPREACIHELFEAQVERTPDAIAVLYEGQCFTYAQLNWRANQLARYLRDAGVGVDQPVGVCVQRGLEMVVGLLGVLKAGAAFLPLDPAYPPQRLAYMLKDAVPRVLLTQERLISALPETTAWVVPLDSGSSAFAAREGTNLDSRSIGLTSRHLAYVIYTSGSTGEPKGVAAEHRSMVNRIHAQQSIAPLCVDDICCQKTSVGFVDAVFEIFGPLSYGSRLVVAPPDTARDIEQLTLLVEHQRITRLITVPSLAQSLLESPSNLKRLRSLRSWTLSGEELKGELLTQLQRHLPGCLFINLYGSSEVAADATCYSSRAFAGVNVPIGRPLQNTNVYVLDRNLQPVPLGAAGEIYIGGEGLARGYLNRPALTDERFVPNPFSEDAQARLYRTGDLGRWRVDGLLEYMGRSDHQVKIRGHRIELGELEAQLLRHADVRRACVIAREDTPGEKRLVAYIVSRDKGAAMTAQLRAHLKAALPDYMVPSAFVMLDDLPLTPSGKVDRRVLPPPDPGALVGEPSEAPRGEIEEGLATIWLQLLRVERVGRRANFFELGGHSLLGVKLVSRVAERFGVRLSAAAIFQYPTVQEMAEVVESLRAAHAVDSGAAWSVKSTLERPSGRVCAPLGFTQLAHWRLCQLEVRHSLRQVASAMRLRGPLSIDVLRDSIMKIIRRHAALRTRIVMRDGVPTQEIEESMECRLSVHDLTSVSAGVSAEAEIHRRIDSFLLEPIDLSVGPLFGSCLLRIDDDNHVLIMAMDHMISDAFSLVVLWRDLLGAYAQGIRGRESSFPAAPVQYYEYAIAQRNALSSWLERHDTYWRERMAGYRRVGLPEERKQEGESQPGWGSVRIDIGRELKRELGQWCRLQRTSLAMSVFTAYVALLMRWSSASDLVIQYQVDGRDDRALEGAIGYVAAALLMRVQLFETDTFAGLLNRVTAEYLRAYEHADHAYLSSQASWSELARTSVFNWIPDGHGSDFPESGGSDGSIGVVPFSFENPTSRQYPFDKDPIMGLVDLGEDIVGALYFSLSRFSPPTMETLGHHFMAVIRTLVSEPDRRVKDTLLA